MTSEVKIADTGQLFTVGEVLGDGIEATVCAAVENEDFAIRLLKEPLDGGIEVERIEHQISAQLLPGGDGYRFGMPFARLVDPKAEELTVGFLMRRARDTVSFEYVAAASDWLPSQFVYRVATNLVRAVKQAADAGYRIIDWNNELVGQDSRVTLIDTTSWALQGSFGCYCAKPEWIAPEVLQQLHDQQCSFRDIEFTELQSRFGLGVELCKLIRRAGGEHIFRSHYTGTEFPPPSTVRRIREGRFVWGTAAHQDYSPPTNSPPLADLDVDFQALILRCFENGHSDPTERPSPEDWLQVLEQFDVPGPVELTSRQWECVKTNTKPILPAMPTLPRFRPRLPSIPRISIEQCKKPALAAGVALAFIGTGTIAFQHASSSLLDDSTESDVRVRETPPTIPRAIAEKREHKWQFPSEKPRASNIGTGTTAFQHASNSLLEDSTESDARVRVPAPTISEAIAEKREHKGQFPSGDPRTSNETPVIWDHLRVHLEE